MNTIVSPRQVESSQADERHRLFGHSADVDLALHVDGERLALSHVANDFVRLATPRPGLAGPAKVEIVVDGVVTLDDCDLLGYDDRDPQGLRVRFHKQPAPDATIAQFLKQVGYEEGT
jgi:hypothetical protein